MVPVVEVAAPIVTALVSLFPMAILIRAYRVLPARQILVAIVGFAVFVVGGAATALAALGYLPIAGGPEDLELVTDVLGIVLFAIAFMVPTKTLEA
ncbi:MAG: hypothetical protein ACYDDF_02950 [Thermoplasmatota archaeon]